MSPEVFTASLALIKGWNTYLTLGGGEPTVHPAFMAFAWQAIRTMLEVTAEMGTPVVGVVTNGKKTDLALELARMAECGLVSARLSQDVWHEPIEDKVYRAFRRSTARSSVDARAIGGTTLTNLVPVGRARGWATESRERCFCPSLLIKPTGDLYHCSCCKRYYGNVLDKSLTFPWWFSDVLQEEGCSRTFHEPEEPVLTLKGD